MRFVIGACVLALIRATTAQAEPEPGSHEPGRHLIYVEAFGKGGPWGLGWEGALTPRIAIGAVASAAVIRDQQLYTIAPYLHFTVARRGANAFFGELGTVVTRSVVPSPVPEWDGMTDTGIGVVSTAGWERNMGRLALRASIAVVAGEGGVTPWGGISLGVRP